TLTTYAVRGTSNQSTIQYFSSKLPGTQKSTLFPYTTLFRSDEVGALEEDFDRIVAQLNASGDDVNARWQGEQMKKLQAESTVVVDRKSTRLNSSHVAISYAVFCLKKKNKRLYLSHNLKLGSV